MLLAIEALTQKTFVDPSVCSAGVFSSIKLGIHGDLGLYGSSWGCWSLFPASSWYFLLVGGVPVLLASCWLGNQGLVLHQMFRAKSKGVKMSCSSGSVGRCHLCPIPLVSRHDGKTEEYEIQMVLSGLRIKLDVLSSWQIRVTKLSVGCWRRSNRCPKPYCLSSSHYS